MLTTGLYGGTPSWMLPEDRSAWGRQQATLPQASPQPQQMLPAQYQPQAQQPSWGQPQQPAQQPQGQNPYIQPVQPKPFIPDMGFAQGNNPLYTQQQPQQPQDNGRWQRTQQLFNTPGYTNDPGFGGSAADQARARQQNQQIAQNMFPQIYGGQQQSNSPWQMQYAQQNGMWGQHPNYDRSSQTPTSNYSYQVPQSQNPFISSEMPSTQNNIYGIGIRRLQTQNPFMQNPQMAQLMQILSLIQNMGFGGRQSTPTSYIPTMGVARYTGQSSGPTQEQTQNWLNSISQAGRDWYNAGSPRDPNAPLGTWANPRPL